MSAIDDLNRANKPITINATGPSVKVEKSDAGSLSIDATGKDVKTSQFNMTQPVENQNRHKFVRQEPKRSPESAGGIKIKTNEPKRTVVSQSAIPVQPEPETQEVHLSPVDDMVGIDNPNSMFSKMIARKEEEAREWVAAKEEEAAVLAEETDDVNTGVIGEETESIADNRKIVEDDDIDLDSTEEEEEDMTDELTVDEMIDKEDLPEAEPIKVEEEPVFIVEKEEAIEEPHIDIEEEEFELDDEEEESDSEATPINNTIDESEDSDEDEDDNQAADEPDEDEVLKNLQKMITEKIKPLSSTLNISTFTIAKKPVTNINNIINDTKARVVKWVLPNQGAIVKMRDFSGAEFEKLREYSENTRSIDSLNRSYKMIYDHIESPKPANFDAWLKATPFSDIEHYFFAIYIANFKGANFLPIDCQNNKCKNTWVTEDIDIMKMVKFEKDEDKKKFTSIYKSEDTAATGRGIYVTQAVPISNHIAVAFREPSIYGRMEENLIDDRTREKYSAIIDYIPYIDEIYEIDLEHETLVPIGYKRFPENASRDIRSKIQKYASVFATLTSDEFGPIKAYARAIAERNDGISYQFPELTCPKCKSKIDAETVSARALVFTRYQLGSLTSTLLN